MNKQFKDFYDTLLENLDSYGGEHESFINYGPNLFKLLCDLLNCEINSSLRLPICGAIAYYVTPDDVISEQIYGPYGYIDDIYLACHVLKMVASEHGYDFLQKNSNFEVEPIVKECESKSLEILNNEEVESIIAYVGL